MSCSRRAGQGRYVSADAYSGGTAGPARSHGSACGTDLSVLPDDVDAEETYSRDWALQLRIARRLSGKWPSASCCPCIKLAALPTSPVAIGAGCDDLTLPLDLHPGGQHLALRDRFRP